MAKKGPMTYEEIAKSLGNTVVSPHSGDKTPVKSASSSAVRAYDFTKPGPAAEPPASPAKPKVAGTPPKQAEPSPGVTKQFAQFSSDISANTTSLKRLDVALAAAIADIATVNSNVDGVLKHLLELEARVNDYFDDEDEDPNGGELATSPSPGEDPGDAEP